MDLQGIDSRTPQAFRAKATRQILQALALPQIALVVLIMSRYHVQIITRLSSGYVVWYWWIAKSLSEIKGIGYGKVAKMAIVWMVVYGILQCVLFASFLPPA